MGKAGTKKINIPVVAAIIVLCGLLLGNTINVKAYDNIELILSESGEASPTIFSEGNAPIAPGSKISKSFSIRNNTSRNYNIVGFKLTNFELVHADSGKVKDTSLINNFTSNVRISLESKGLLWNKTIFDGTMSEILNNDGLKFDENKIPISKGESKEFLINISMNESADNSLQDLQANFGTNFSAVSNDGTNANTGGKDSGKGGSGGGSTGGGSTGAGVSTGPGGTNTNPTTGGSIGENTNPPTAPTSSNGSNPPTTTNGNGGTDMPVTPPQGGGQQNLGGTNVPVSTSNGNGDTKPGDGNIPKRLIKTGSLLDTETLLTLGIISTCTGLVLILKKNKN